MSDQSESERADKMPVKQELYRTEAYISEIRIGGKNVCEIKLKPTEDFAVRVAESESVLIALVGSIKASAGKNGNVKKNSVGKLLSASEFFLFADKGDAACLSYDFILSLKQQHVNVSFVFNGKGEIETITVK